MPAAISVHRTAIARRRDELRHSTPNQRASATKAHETTTNNTKKFKTVMIERHRTKNKTKSASDTIAEPNNNETQKHDLNRAIQNDKRHQIETMLSTKPSKTRKSIRAIPTKPDRPAKIWIEERKTIKLRQKTRDNSYNANQKDAKNNKQRGKNKVKKKDKKKEMKEKKKRRKRERGGTGSCKRA